MGYLTSNTRGATPWCQWVNLSDCTFCRASSKVIPWEGGVNFTGSGNLRRGQICTLKPRRSVFFGFYFVSPAFYFCCLRCFLFFFARVLLLFVCFLFVRLFYFRLSFCLISFVFISSGVFFICVHSVFCFYFLSFGFFRLFVFCHFWLFTFCFVFHVFHS